MGTLTLWCQMGRQMTRSSCHHAELHHELEDRQYALEDRVDVMEDKEDELDDSGKGYCCC